MNVNRDKNVKKEKRGEGAKSKSCSLSFLYVIARASR